MRSITGVIASENPDYFLVNVIGTDYKCKHCFSHEGEEHSKDCLVPLVLEMKEEIVVLNKRIKRFVEAILDCDSKNHHKIINDYEPPIQKKRGGENNG